MATSKKIIDIANSLDFVNDYNNIGITGNNARISTSQYGELLLYSTSPSTNGSIGAIVLYNGGLSINSTANTSSITSGGAMTIMGGASILKNLLIGGNIGIGISNPSFTLDVNGTGNFTNITVGTLSTKNIISTSSTTTTLIATNITAANINITGNLYQNGSLYISSPWTQYNNNLAYTVGNIGINTTSPSYTLDVNGTGRFTNLLSTSSTTTTLNATGITTGNINFTGNLYQNGQPYASNTSQWTTYSNGNLGYSSGNIGIGNTNPSYRLDVVGNYRIANGTSSSLVSSINNGNVIEIQNNSSVGNSSIQFNDYLGSTKLFTGYSNPYNSSVLAGSSYIMSDTATSLKLIAGNQTSIPVILNASDNSVSITSSIDSTDIYSGSLKVSGGIGVSKTLHFGNYIVANSSLTLAPSASTYGGNGSRFILYQGTLNTATPYAIGIENGNLWNSSPYGGYKWYTNTSVSMQLSSGNLSVTGGITSNSISTSTLSATTLSATTITASNLSLSGDLTIAGTLTAVNITSTNLKDTNISTSTLNVSNISTLTNVTATNISTGTLIASTGLSTGSILNNTSSVSNSIYQTFKNGNNSLGYIGLDGFGYFNNNLGAMTLATATNNPLVFATNSTQRAIIVSNGNFGINTSTPAYTLDVNGTINISGTSTLTNITATNLSTGTLIVSTSLSTGTINASGTSTLTNITATNLSTGILIASTGLSTGTINASGTSTLTNLTSTNISTGILVASTSITAGNIRINSNSNPFGLYLQGSHVDGPVLKLENTAVGGLTYAVGSTSTASGAGRGFSIYDQTNSICRLLVGSSGNIGINTVTPTFNLDVNGTIRASGTSTLSNVTSTNISTGTINASTINNTAWDPTCIFSNNTTLGSTAVGAFLAPGLPVNAVTTTYFGKSLSSGNSGQINYNYIGSNNTANSIAFGNYGRTSVMYVLNSGNVGINTSVPSYTLDVNGTGNISSVFTIQNGLRLTKDLNINYIQSGVSTTTANSTADLRFTNINGTTAYMTITTIGNIGINTTSPGGCILDIRGTIGIGVNDMVYMGKDLTNNNTAIIDLNYIGSGNSSNSIGLGLFGANNKMVIQANGNVGINTTNPGYTLDVNGGIRATNISSGILVASTGLSTGTIYASGISTLTNTTATNFSAGNINAQSLTISNGNLVVTSGTLYASDLNMTGSITMNSNMIKLGGQGGLSSLQLDTTNIDGPTLNGNLGGRLSVSGGDYLRWENSMVKVPVTFSAGNIIGVNISTATLIASTGISTGSIYASGISLNGNFVATGDITAFGNLSDKRLKKNITPIQNGLDIVNQLEPVIFSWKDTISNTSKRGTKDVGFIAQEVEKLIPYAVSEFSDINTGQNFKSIKHERIIPYLVMAIQQLTKQVADLQKVI